MAIRRYKRSMRKRGYKRRLRRTMGRLVKSPRFNNVLNVKRTFWLENWSLSTVATSNFWRYYTFTLAQLPSYTEFTNIFDTFKLRGVKVTFRPRYDSFSGENTTDTTLPGITNQAGNYVHVINDPYSTVTPSGTYTTTNLNSFLENGNVKTHNGNRPFSFYVRPCVDSYVSGSSTASRKRSPWMQTNNAPQVHNGAHIFLQDINMTGTSGNSYDVFYTFYLSFKNLK